jgi:hypothetical protein
MFNDSKEDRVENHSMGTNEADVLPLNYSRYLFYFNNLQYLSGNSNTIEHHTCYNGRIFNTVEGGEMKVRRERYQHGSVRKVPRSQGFAWEFRFYITAPNGKRKLKLSSNAR